jgi:hypothetical protein
MSQESITARTEQLLAEHLDSYIRGPLAAQIKTLIKEKYAEERENVARFEAGLVQQINAKQDRIETGKENLLMLAQKYVLHKKILGHIAQDLRAHRIKRTFMTALKEESKLRKFYELKAKFELKKYRQKLLKKMLGAWKMTHREESEKHRIGLLQKQFESEYAKNEALHKDLLVKMEAILKSKITELATKTVKLDQVKQKYAELAK